MSYLLTFPLLVCIRFYCCIIVVLLLLVVCVSARVLWGWGSGPGVGCVVVFVVCWTIAAVTEGLCRVGVLGDSPALSVGQTAYSFLPFADVVGVFCIEDAYPARLNPFTLA